MLEVPLVQSTLMNQLLVRRTHQLKMNGIAGRALTMDWETQVETHEVDL